MISKSQKTRKVVAMLAAALILGAIIAAIGQVVVAMIIRVPRNADSIVEAMFDDASDEAVIAAIEDLGHVDAVSEKHRLSFITAAVVTRRSQILEWLISNGADLNPDGFTPLEAAFEARDVRLARRLVSAGADLSHRLEDGQTVREWAKMHASKTLEQLDYGTQQRGAITPPATAKTQVVQPSTQSGRGNRPTNAPAANEPNRRELDR